MANFQWEKEVRPRWDADKQRLFDAAALAATGVQPGRPDAPIADEWWDVRDEHGTLVGYGWLDSEWGDAQIAFLVDPACRGRGAGVFAVERLEAEARDRGLNYIYNVVPETHPDAAWMTAWLTSLGFERAGDAPELRRRVSRAA